MSDDWLEVWYELLRNLRNQPTCKVHPIFPCVKTLSQGIVNDIVEVSQTGIIVKSHRTGKEDSIKSNQFETWWLHLLEKGSASLKPGHENNPHADRSRLVGAILVSCLPVRIKKDKDDPSTILLAG
jgi:hypothetical protein